MGQVVGRLAEQPAVDLVVVLAQFGSQPADLARRFRQPGEHVLHGDLAELGVGHTDDRVAGREVRIVKHVGGPEDPAGGHALVQQDGVQLVRGERAGPRGDELVELVLLLTPGRVGAEPVVAGEVR